MCWSGEASTALTIIGFGTASYLAYKGDSKDVWVPVTYFSCMELLQAFTYLYINLCDAPPNQILTYLGYLHIAFQPFFVNMLAMHFIPAGLKQKIQLYVYTLCSVCAVVILIKMYPFVWAGKCNVGIETFCGENACTMYGSWHVAWQLPLNGLMSSYSVGSFVYQNGLHAFAYVVTVFLLPLLYGSWRFVCAHFLAGPLFSSVLAVDPNEWAAVWCLISIPMLLSAFLTPFRRYLYVTHWYSYHRKQKWIP